MTSENEAEAADGSRGPRTHLDRNALTKRRIVTAAISLVDEDGIDKLTMRRLGARLGVDPAAFYRHFPDKAALLRAIGRAAIAEIELPALDETVTWESWVIHTRTEYRALLVERPYLVPLVLNGLIPWQSLPAYSIERHLLVRQGFSERDIGPVFDAIDAFVVGSAAVTSAVSGSSQAAAARGVAAPGDATANFKRGLRALLRGLRAELDDLSAD